MTTWRTVTNVARYHLIQWQLYFLLPWGIMMFSFAVNLVVASQIPNTDTGGLATIYVWVFIGGLFSTFKSLQFGLALGISRRSYYLGTAGLAVALAAGYGLALTGLQAIEAATDGWGQNLGFFRVGYILDGPWYLTWLTSFVCLALMFVYGMWFGIVYRRWSVLGMTSFVAAQILLLVAAALLATWTDAWSRIGDFFSALSATGLTGVLAVLMVALFAGGYGTMRRAAV
ncbi:ABC transporter permease [Frankia sp. CNm7]|uniref:ABC transporter permease n=1 Tax=Frankia nepalensis TaxID=1836974 RepID=A0A937RPE4_9ACTN|nr:ABC transporter permease [Frankia nepalensis]MBL7502610.1 ABC transporter permease [Frankia nepalensis]MBL7514788.1 ABC transporter permease [Frankia nepalensis]MBL7522865.1 ABC transporter permease [Frankia nepalensis]MBL7629561.1 ABC transporter permease [Frankia nepalensis]